MTVCAQELQVVPFTTDDLPPDGFPRNLLPFRTTSPVDVVELKNPIVTDPAGNTLAASRFNGVQPQLLGNFSFVLVGVLAVLLVVLLAPLGGVLGGILLGAGAVAYLSALFRVLGLTDTAPALQPIPATLVLVELFDRLGLTAPGAVFRHGDTLYEKGVRKALDI